MNIFDKLDNRIRLRKLNGLDVSAEEEQELDVLADTIDDMFASCDMDALERDLQHKKNEMRMFTGPEKEDVLKRVQQISEYVAYIYKQCINTYRDDNTDKYLDILNFACMELYLVSDKLEGLGNIKNNKNIRVPEIVLQNIKSKSKTVDGFKTWALLFEKNLNELQSAIRQNNKPHIFAASFRLNTLGIIAPRFMSKRKS